MVYSFQSNIGKWKDIPVNQTKGTGVFGEQRIGSQYQRKHYTDVTTRMIAVV